MAIEIVYDGSKADPTVLGYVPPEEARRLAKYLEIAANKAERVGQERK